VILLKKKIVTICTANRCRSIIAAVFLQHLLKERHLEDKADVVSAGIMADDYWSYYSKLISSFGCTKSLDDFYGVSPYYTTTSYLQKSGWEVESYLSQQFSSELAASASLVIAMENEQKQTLLERFPELSDKVFTLRELAGKDGHLLLEESYYKPEHDPDDPHFVCYSDQYVGDSAREIELCLEQGFPRLVEIAGL
jgi:protein-tyrosine-phosphatase